MILDIRSLSARCCSCSSSPLGGVQVRGTWRAAATRLLIINSVSVVLSQFPASAGREGGSVQRQQVRTTVLLQLGLTVLTVCCSVLQMSTCCSFFIVCRTKIDEINQRKEEELKAMNLRIQKLQTDLMAANQVRDQLHTATQCTQHLCITKYFRWKQTTFPASAVHVSRCRKGNRSLCFSQRNDDQRHKTEHKFIYSLSL